MKVTNAYQIIITEKFTQSRAFYKSLASHRSLTVTGIASLSGRPHHPFSLA